MEKSKNKRRRSTEIISIDAEEEARRAFGAQELIRVMQDTVPMPGRSIHLITGGNVDLICHIRWLIDKFTPPIKFLFISCWAISATDIMLLKQWRERGWLDEINLIVGDIYPSNYKKEWEKINEFIEKGIIHSVHHSNIHSKIMLMHFTSGEHVVIESSANCNMNPRVEQSVISQSELLFNFYKDYFTDIISMEKEKEQRKILRSIR